MNRPGETPPDTGMREGKGEDWKVRCDGGWQVPCDEVGDPAFYAWWNSRPAHWENSDSAINLLHQAWRDARKEHVATLRRIGWLDQKGRVWLEAAPAVPFDGGSLTPLLIDPRDDD